MDKIMETLDTVGIILFVFAALREHKLYLSLFFCLFTPCSASVTELQIVNNNSSYESTAKWETSQIFRGRLAGAYVTKTVTVLGASIAAVSIVMTAYTNHRKTSSGS